MGTDFWNAERVDLIKARWAAGANAYEIADEIGCTRNAVLGKARRLNLGLHANSWKSHVGERASTNPTPRKRGRRGVNKLTRLMFEGVAYKRPFESSIEKPAFLNIPLTELAVNSCRFPTTDDKPHLFCGNPQTKDSSYCPFHHRLCYVPAKNREPKSYRPKFVFGNRTLPVVNLDEAA